MPIPESIAAFQQALRAARSERIEVKIFDGAGHGIRDGPRVRAAYLEFTSRWAAEHFGLSGSDIGSPGPSSPKF
ncbi:MAG: hypothetical protein ACRD16_01800 [Thermoanaerobaculia bacterium]